MEKRAVVARCSRCPPAAATTASCSGPASTWRRPTHGWPRPYPASATSPPTRRRPGSCSPTCTTAASWTCPPPRPASWSPASRCTAPPFPPGSPRPCPARRPAPPPRSTLLQDFFADRGTCANRKFADYFGVDVPDACCTTAAEPLLSVLGLPHRLAARPTPGRAGPALLIDRPRPAGWRVDAAAKARRLDEQVRMLLWAVDRGSVGPRRAAGAARPGHVVLRPGPALGAAADRGRDLPVLRRQPVGDAATGRGLARPARCRRPAVAAGRRWRDAGNVARSGVGSPGCPRRERA